MKVKSIKTHKITAKDDNLFKLLDKYIRNFEENSILVITSKIVAILEGNVILADLINKDDLVKKESEYFLPPEANQYHISLAIKNGLLMAAAGIDESNGDGNYILWPKQPQKTANKVRKYLIKRFGVKNVGVIITDSKTSPMRFGTTGVSISHSGFKALKNYIGKPDIFGRFLKMTKANIVDALASTAVLVMGEGQEQTPLAIITDVLFVKFIKTNPSKKELKELYINIADDIYGDFIKNANWQKGDQTSEQKLK